MLATVMKKTETASPEADAGVRAIFKELTLREALGLEVHSAAELAEILGISRQAIYKWVRVPAERVIRIEKAIGVSRHVQRPDVFGPARIRKAKTEKKARR